MSESAPDAAGRTRPQTPAEMESAAVRSGGNAPSLPSGYALVRELGRGGMGIVYLAEQTDLRRRVALKMILAGGYASDAAVARFRTEMAAMGRVRHPNVLAVHAGGWHGGLPYLAAEYLDGGSLADRLAANPPDPFAAVGLMAAVARGVAACHAEGVLHRDLKPANILLAADGTPKVADFGLAKVLADEAGHTSTGAVLGTPHYMAPEQASASLAEVGPAADVYGLGAVLYHLLSGRPPFVGPNSAAVLVQVVSADLPPPLGKLRSGLPRGLDTVVGKCLSKRPADRYPSAEALADDLERVACGERPTGRVQRRLMTRRRVLAVSASAAIAGTFAVWSLWLREPEAAGEVLFDQDHTTMAGWNGVGGGLVLETAVPARPVAAAAAGIAGGWRFHPAAPARLAALVGTAPVTRTVAGGRALRVLLELDLREAVGATVAIRPHAGGDDLAAVAVSRAGGAGGVPFPDLADRDRPVVLVKLERADGRWAAFFEGQEVSAGPDPRVRGPYTLVVTPDGGTVRIISALVEPVPET